VVLIQVLDGPELLFSEHFACVYCGISLGEIEPRSFSFNSPHGACSACSGSAPRWRSTRPDIPDREVSLAEGAIHPYYKANNQNSYYMKLLEAVAKRYGFSMSVPVRELSDRQVTILLYGTKGERVTVEHEDRSGTAARSTRATRA